MKEEDKEKEKLEDENKHTQEAENLSDVLTKDDIEILKTSREPDEKQRIKRLNELGCSVEIISNAYGYSIAQINKILDSKPKFQDIRELISLCDRLQRDYENAESVGEAEIACDLHAIINEIIPDKMSDENLSDILEMIQIICLKEEE